ncbi:Drug/Metabolite Transporter (DMT) Superfamily [Trachipleistophora hominis]|uniref:Drug/Metabolite Transporter (DMT) Superfamily n=1 Tax=Trachipleistophora hominis TaxID=72359 RepID=L7JXQ7_TRAHO|nr:Drug/Metabolite Transporter (DMT) Superfamily [Trachipleistophora hominis]
MFMATRMVLLVLGISVYIICSTYKIHLKPEIMPYILPLWFFNLIIVVVSFMFVKKRKYYDFYICLLSVMLVVQSYYSWMNIKKSKVIEAGIAETSSIIFMCILSRIFMKTRITKPRVFAMLITSFGLLMPILFSKEETNINFSTVAGHVCCHFIFCIINIIYELKIKAKITSIWSFFFTSNFFCLILSSFVLLYELLDKGIDLRRVLKDIKVYIIISSESFSILFAFALIYMFLPVERTFLKLVINITAGIFESAVLDKNLKIWDVLSLVIVSLGVFVYNIEYIRRKLKELRRRSNGS